MCSEREAVADSETGCDSSMNSKAAKDRTRQGTREKKESDQYEGQTRWHKWDWAEINEHKIAGL
jgi:hypothetical protein